VRVSDLKIDKTKFDVLVHEDDIVVSAAKPKVVEEETIAET
jgi:hypothetical protein